MVFEPFDVAIRMVESQDSSLIARQLAHLPNYLYASPRYLERLGEPSEPVNLEQHECLTIFKPSEWSLYKGNQMTKVSVGCKFVINSIGMIRN